MNAISPINAASAVKGKGSHGSVASKLTGAQGVNNTPANTGAANAASATNAATSPDTKPVFDQFVGETFYGQMLQAMHKTQHKAAYFNGGRAEEVFQGQLDQVLSQKMSQASAGEFSGAMYDLFNLQRS